MLQRQGAWGEAGPEGPRHPQSSSASLGYSYVPKSI